MQARQDNISTGQVLQLAPSDIRFSQDSVGQRYKSGGSVLQNREAYAIDAVMHNGQYHFVHFIHEIVSPTVLENTMNNKCLGFPQSVLVQDACARTGCLF